MCDFFPLIVERGDVLVMFCFVELLQALKHPTPLPECPFNEWLKRMEDPLRGFVSLNSDGFAELTSDDCPLIHPDIVNRSAYETNFVITLLYL